MSHAKEKGIHYTPPELAAYLADLALAALGERSARVLDPACGDGSLLVSLVERAGPELRARLDLVGIDEEPEAVACTDRRVRELTGRIEVARGDFLDLVEVLQPARGVRLRSRRGALGEVGRGAFDLVIANPPYVRTQVLGAERARRLRGALGLTGRVDLYHAFVVAMSRCLSDGGVLALLCSNRFLTTQAGQSMRTLLTREFCIEQIIDLGDSKPFDAAVLPAIVVARRASTPMIPAQPPSYVAVYEERESRVAPPAQAESVLDALRLEHCGSVAIGRTSYHIDRGTLAPPLDASAPWTLTSAGDRDWLMALAKHTHTTFGRVGQTRVGIKTTADAVFIRSDWDELAPPLQPEATLLRPLLTHDVAAPFHPLRPPRKHVLYPHESVAGRRRAVDLDRHPRARAYLRQHHAVLDARRYLREAGRHWYEIWVPQDPRAWAQPKLVFPDISELPRFYLDRSGAVVGGDCYWITLRPGEPAEWFALMMAVANSSLALRFYDLVCGNRLYAGRRRFITQYVDRFPLPDPATPIAREIIARVAALDAADAAARRAIDALVWQAFCQSPPPEDPA